MWTQTITCGLALIGGMAIAGGAIAQEVQPAQLAEVIVTAQKRAENLQEVPITMQAYTAEQLQAAGVSQVTDITHLAPNLNVVVQNSLSQHIVIRGVGTNEFFGNAPSSVGTYMDEVTMNSSYMSTLGLFDMERVEILRGPQNSLFGRNTTGGAVKFPDPIESARETVKTLRETEKVDVVIALSHGGVERGKATRRRRDAGQTPIDICVYASLRRV